MEETVMDFVYYGHYSIIKFRALKGRIKAVDKEQTKHEGDCHAEENEYAELCRKEHEHRDRPDDDQQEEGAKLVVDHEESGVDQQDYCAEDKLLFGGDVRRTHYQAQREQEQELGYLRSLNSEASYHKPDTGVIDLREKEEHQV